MYDCSVTVYGDVCGRWQSELLLRDVWTVSSRRKFFFRGRRCVPFATGEIKISFVKRGKLLRSVSHWNRNVGPGQKKHASVSKNVTRCLSIPLARPRRGRIHPERGRVSQVDKRNAKIRNETVFSFELVNWETSIHFPWRKRSYKIVGISLASWGKKKKAVAAVSCGKRDHTSSISEIDFLVRRVWSRCFVPFPPLRPFFLLSSTNPISRSWWELACFAPFASFWPREWSHEAIPLSIFATNAF